MNVEKVPCAIWAAFVTVSLPAQRAGTAVSELVPNGSFEVLTDCPAYPSSEFNLPLASPWFSHRRRGYLFADCFEDETLRPPQANTLLGSRLGGYQLPYDGVNHAALSTWTDIESSIGDPEGVIDFIAVRLKRLLVAGTRVSVSMHVAPDVKRGGWNFNPAVFANTIGVAFVTDTAGLTRDTIRTLPYVVHATVPILDTLGWTDISACYTAQGGESYLLIGNFLSDDEMQKVYIGADRRVPPEGTDYYVDAVSVTAFDPYLDTVYRCAGEAVDLTVDGLADVTYDNGTGLISATQPAGDFRLLATYHTDAGCSLTDTTTVVTLAPEEPISVEANVCRDSVLVASFPSEFTVDWGDLDGGGHTRALTPGDYTAYVSTPCGDIRYDYEVGEVDCACVPAAPTAFSPNGDQINDTLSFFGGCDATLAYSRLQVFDRWGGLLYDRDGPAAMTWDGRSGDGRKLDAGVYVFVYTYEYDEGTIVLPLLGSASGHVSGEVHLVR